MWPPKGGFVISAVTFFLLCSEVNSRLTVIDVPKPKEETHDLNWWKNGVFYQIYPRSFQDTDDDGIGDLVGITQKLEHLNKTGITAVWISQIFKSPEKEHSQSISEFTNIHPEYGTMKQFGDLIAEAKRVGIKVILDFVLNHSSNKHAWFIKSEAEEEGFEDYYIWRNEKLGTNERTPPTNWLSVYGKSAWEWNAKRNQYYLHQFSVDQPDLNYGNPKVKEEMKNFMTFWLDKGIDGFRLDSVPFLFESKFEDEPKSNDTTAQPHEHKSLRHDYTMDQNETYQFIYELRAFIDQYNKNHPSEPEKILMSEAYTSIESTMKYYGDKEQHGVHIPFNFQLIPLHRSSYAKKLVNSINEWLENMPEEQTANWLIGNHDHHRAATRFESNSIKNMNILIALLPGIMVTYNGEEIGQENGEVTYEQCKDPIGCQAEPMDFPKVSRDFQRTPYHWSDVDNGGFTNGTPWLPVSQEYRRRNLKNQIGNPGSYFEIYKEILKLRQEEPFKSGEVKVEALTDYVIKITRGSKSEEYGDTVALISIYFDPVKIQSTDIQGQLYEVLYSSHSSIEKNTKIWAKEVTIPAYSTVIFKVISKQANYNWWKHALIYQVYPRSFKDSNNDGNGDLNGIMDKLPYLKDLGVDVVWLSPIYQSPQVDQGYDISDFKAVDQIYGTMEDFDKLITQAKELEMKIVMDFVPNHSSDQHEWFIKSTNNVSDYKDYYVWKKCIGNNKPNNWLSSFKRSAWARISERPDECYYHQFEYRQPDLNYRNDRVKQEMKDILKFWLDKGVAGFRMDAVPYLVEDEKFSDEPRSNNVEAKPEEWKYLRHIYTSDVKETFDVIYEWREFMDTYTAVNGGIERIMMTEAYTDIYTTMYYYGSGDRLGAHFTFNFQLIEGVDGTSDATDFTAAIKQWIELLPKGSTSNWVLGNHDKHRLATRFGPENLDGLNMLGAILPGVMVTYNGEEIGLENGEVTWIQGKDPNACNGGYPNFDKVSRDFERTPFHWDNSTNAGFNIGTQPWLPVSEKYIKTNLLSQVNQTASHYELYKRLVQLRKLPAFVNGTFEIAPVTKYVLASLRKDIRASESYFHIFNLGRNEETFSLKTAYNETTAFLEIIETNDQENLPVGSLLNVANMTLRAHQSVIAIPTEEIIPTPSSALVYVMPKFAVVLCLLINAINLNYT